MINNLGLKEKRVFNINFNFLSMDELIKIVISDKCNNIVVVNVAVLVMCQRDRKFLDVVNSADIVTVDSVPLLWALKFLGYDIEEKLSGPDIFRRLLELASDERYNVYFLGTRQEILEKMIVNLKNLFPKLNIVGYRDGFFKNDEEEKIIKEVNSLKTDMLFLGIPSPAKERFINNKNLKCMLSMGVGGVFDIEAGLVKRAPLWMQKKGLEWSYRLMQEPRRLWKRYLITNSIFIYIVIKEIIKRGK